MAEKPGFLDSIGVGSVDETDIMQAQVHQHANDRFKHMQAVGQQAGVGLGALIKGGIQGVKEKSFRSFLEGTGQGLTQGIDRLTANQMGISVDQLQGRRKIRKLTTDAPTDGSFEGRLSLLQKIADTANQHGDLDVLGNTLRQMDQVRTEQEEFAKLQSQRRKAEDEESDARFAYLNGKPIAYAADTVNGVHGAWIDGPNGRVFRPWGEGFSQNDPTKLRTGDTDDKILRQRLGAKDFNYVRESLRSQKSLVQKYDSVLDLLVQAEEAGAAEEIVGDAGKVISFLDNKVRAIRGVLEAFVPGDTFFSDQKRRGDDPRTDRDETWQGLDWWKGQADNPNAELWELVQLPEGFRDASAAAQNYRAQIIELAYLSARAAEPSNRGLSDNDIKNALKRLGAESGNPAVMMRRSFEIVISGSRALDDAIDSVSGSFERPDGSYIERDAVARIMGGDALVKYRGDINALYEKYGATPQPSGRVHIANPIDSDVNPATGTPGTGGGGAAPPVSDAELEAAVEGLFKKPEHVNPEGRE